MNWISVEFALPGVNENGYSKEVLTYGYSSIEIYRLKIYKNGKKIWFSQRHSNAHFLEVTHWMPLPEEPK